MPPHAPQPVDSLHGLKRVDKVAVQQNFIRRPEAKVDAIEPQRAARVLMFFTPHACCEGSSLAAAHPTPSLVAAVRLVVIKRADCS